VSLLCHYADRQYPEWHFADNHYADCNYDFFHYENFIMFSAFELIVTINVNVLSVNMTNFSKLSVIFSKCHSPDCHSPDCHSVECHYSAARNKSIAVLKNFTDLGHIYTRKNTCVNSTLRQIYTKTQKLFLLRFH
jgi:hypothetical protein